MPSAALPSRIPIFPLPNVVLFPRVFLPLHIFEPRYREMVSDAIAGEQLMGMVLLRDGWREHSDPNPRSSRSAARGGSRMSTRSRRPL